MELRTIFLLLALLVTAGAFADAYTWTDEDGVVHYSDRPQPGATLIELGQSNAPRPRPTTRPAATASSTDPDEEQGTQARSGYESLEIASPAAEETLWNIEATLSVTLTLTPALKPGHQVRVYFDGTPQMVGGTRFRLDEVYRGVHNLQAEVIDGTGKLIIRSRPSRFYVQQNTIIN
jgi:Domain of unknown function (DUF4124)